MARGFGFGSDGGASDLIRGFNSTIRQGEQGARNVAAFQNRIGKVTGEDLAKLGIRTMALGPAGSLSPDAVDPQAMKFDAMMALKKAQQTGLGVKQAQQRLDDAEMIGAGVDEVLRRRQQGFNQYGEEAKQGQHRANWAPYGGGAPDPLITAGTGAAIASHARAGRPISFPDNAQRQFSESDARRAMHLGGGMPSSRNQQAPYVVTSADVNGDRLGGPISDSGFMSRRQGAIDSAVAGLGRARGPQRMQAFSGRPF